MRSVCKLLLLTQSTRLLCSHAQTIRKYLHDRVLPKLREKRDSFLLEELVVRWENHNLMNKWMNKFFVYLNRYYVDHNNVPQLLDAGVSAFKNVIFQHIKVDATRAMITLINKERDGEAIDRSILKRCVDVYEKMGDPGLEVYHEVRRAAVPVYFPLSAGRTTSRSALLFVTLVSMSSALLGSAAIRICVQQHTLFITLTRGAAWRNPP